MVNCECFFPRCRIKARSTDASITKRLFINELFFSPVFIHAKISWWFFFFPGNKNKVIHKWSISKWTFQTSFVHGHAFSKGTTLGHKCYLLFSSAKASCHKKEPWCLLGVFSECFLVDYVAQFLLSWLGIVIMWFLCYDARLKPTSFVVVLRGYRTNLILLPNLFVLK